MVPSHRCVGVDAGEVDLVRAGREVGDQVALGGAGRAVLDAVEIVEVAGRTAGADVAAAAALEQVEAAVALEGVGGAGADGTLDAAERVGLGAALGGSGDEVDDGRGAAAEAGQVDPVAAVEQVVAGAAVEQVVAGLAAQRVVAGRGP